MGKGTRGRGPRRSGLAFHFGNGREKEGEGGRSVPVVGVGEEQVVIKRGCLRRGVGIRV